MNILLSAYACEPLLGSEPGVGWNWTIEIAKRGHSVWVLTRPMHKEKINDFFSKSENQYLNERINFIYYDLPFWKRKRGTWGTHLHYILWQIGILRIAKKILNRESIDYIHHITFVTTRFPSFLCYLNKPFIFGPVAGGEKPPIILKQDYPFVCRIKDFIRELSNNLVRLNPFIKLTFAKAYKIYTTSEQTKKLIPSKYHSKVENTLAIGSEDTLVSMEGKNTIQNGERIKILFAGNLLYWKGIHLALKAFKEFKKKSPNSNFTIIGNGPEEKWLKDITMRMGLSDSVIWRDKMNRNQLLKEYENYNLFLFPSLQDSGGMVVIEALSKGLPVVSLDIGGPGLVVDSSCGRRVTTMHKTQEDIILELANSIYELSSKEVIEKLSFNAQKRAKAFTWESVIDRVYSDLEKDFDLK